MSSQQTSSSSQPSNANDVPPNPPKESRRISRLWTFIGGGSFAGLLAIIGTVIAYLSFVQQSTDAISSDQAQATIVSILEAQLQVQRELATIEANPVQTGPTATVLAQRANELVATQEVLETRRRNVESTQTAIAINRTSPDNNNQSNPDTNQLQGPALVSCPDELLFGQTAECSIDNAAEVDVYKFTANLNDMVFIRFLKVSGSLYLRMSVEDSKGNIVCRKSDDMMVNITCAINTAGDYKIKVDDYYSRGTGEYRLYIQRLNNPGLTRMLDFGEIKSGDLSMIGEIDVYVLSADINDILTIRFGKTSGAFYPSVYVYDMGGKAICGEFDDMIVVYDCAINMTGQYFVFVGDYYAKSTGQYNILIQRMNKPGNFANIQRMQVVDGSLDLPAEIDAFSFTGQANEVVVITLTRNSGSFYPRLSVVNSLGVSICRASNEPTATVSCTLPTNGDYYLYVDDSRLSRSGTYTIQVRNP